MLPLLWPFFSCRTLVMVMAMTMNVMMKRQLLCQRFSLSRKAQPWWTHLDTEGPSLSSALSISSDFFIIINAIDVSKLVLFLLVPGLDQNMGTREGGGRNTIINHHHSSHFPPSPTQLFSKAEDERMDWKSNENNWLPLNDYLLLCHDLVKRGPYKLNKFKLKELKDQKRGDDKNQSKLPLEAPPRAIDGYYFQFTTTIPVNAIINNLTTIIILFYFFIFKIIIIKTLRCCYRVTEWCFDVKSSGVGFHWKACWVFCLPLCPAAPIELPRISHHNCPTVQGFDHSSDHHDWCYGGMLVTKVLIIDDIAVFLGDDNNNEGNGTKI